MKKSNYALISALFDRKGSLYKEIYLPIIKYTIASLFYEEKYKQDYYTLDNISEFIVERFGIKIPHVVLLGSLQNLLNQKDKFDLLAYENGSSFKINNVWDISENLKIDTDSKVFEDSIDSLESGFREFLTERQLEDDKKFIDFITDNTDDILGFFEGKNLEKVDKKYYSITSYLDYLSKTDSVLYDSASKLFWGSIIAAFLMHDEKKTPKTKIDKVEYFFDTSLIMAVLDLSTTESKNYADDLLGILKSTNSILRVHPLTLAEVKSIFHSVEYIGAPRFGTEIADAYIRRKLTLSELKSIELKISEKLDEYGISIMPSEYEINVQDVINKYKLKEDVKSLQRQRNSYFHDDLFDIAFRDVHDIFMDDYIRERRQHKSNSNIYFLTKNSELVAFCNKRSVNKGQRNMMSASKIIIELWMHNAFNSNIQSRALSESIARCQSMSSIDIQKKLGVVAKYYNKLPDEESPELFDAIVTSLVKQDKKVLGYVDELSNPNNTDEESNQLLLDLAQTAKDNMTKYEGNMDVIMKELEIVKEELNILRSERNNMEEDNKQIVDDNEDLKNANIKLMKIIELMNDKNTIIKDGNALKESKRKKEKEFESRVNYFPYYFSVVVFIISIISLLCFIVWGVSDNFIFSNKLGLIVSLGVAIPSIYFNIHTYSKKKLYNSQMKDFKNMDEGYQKIVEEINILEQKMNEINEQISSLKNEE